MVETQICFNNEGKLAETPSGSEGRNPVVQRYKDNLSFFGALCTFGFVGLDFVQDDSKSEEDGQQAAINRKRMDLESVDR